MKGLPIPVLDKVFKTANLYEFAIDVALHSRIKIPYVQTAFRYFLIQKLWMCLKFWLTVNKKEFDLFIDLTDIAIHYKSIVLKEDLRDFCIRDVYFFMHEDEPGLVYKQKVYKIHSIQIPGFRINGLHHCTFQIDGDLRIKAKYFMDLPEIIKI
jgi:hypothetical protein